MQTTTASLWWRLSAPHTHARTHAYTRKNTHKGTRTCTHARIRVHESYMRSSRPTSSPPPNPCRSRPWARRCLPCRARTSSCSAPCRSRQRHSRRSRRRARRQSRSWADGRCEGGDVVWPGCAWWCMVHGCERRHECFFPGGWVGVEGLIRGHVALPDQRNKQAGRCGVASCWSDDAGMAGGWLCWGPQGPRRQRL